MLPVFSLLALVATAQAQFQSFLTRPDITGAVEFQILTPAADPSTLAPGYYFITPYVSDFNSAAFGPMIFDYNGTLIWYGNGTVHVRGQDLHVCDFNDHGVGTHICYNDAAPVAQGGHSSGTIRFFDNTYTQVGGADYGAVQGLPGPDIHELNTGNFGDGTSFIQESYNNSGPMDLSAYNGPTDGYVWNGCFQQVDFNSQAVLFQWCSLDYVGLNETEAYMDETVGQYFGPISGNGSAAEPWDYAHINAIDPTPSGDFLVSLRHMHTIYKIAGPQTTSGLAPGDIIWRLGGKLSNFTLDNFQFSWQHNVRSQGSSGTVDQLTIFDNSGDGKSQTANSSTGKWIQVDSTQPAATLVHQWDMPEGFISSSQGSVQTLGNGNILVGWGSIPYFTEYDSNENVLTHVHFGVANWDLLQNYRAWKYPWSAIPAEPPAILPYAQNCTGTLYAYVSWNGATEAASYSFFKTQTLTTTPTEAPITVNKTGFETQADLGAFAPYVFVQALDASGNVIGTSASNATFVPNTASAGSCTQESCNAGFVYETSNAQTCGTMNLADLSNTAPGPAPDLSAPKAFQGVNEAEPPPPSGTGVLGGLLGAI